MLSPLIKNTNFRYYTFVLVILFMKLHSQDINSQYSLELNPGISNQWWSQYNNYGRELSEIGLTYKTNYKMKNVNLRLNIFASKNQIHIGESYIKSKLFSNTYLRAGKYYKDFSKYLNDDLSSGSLLISNNAEPMPKVGLLSSYKFKKNQNINFNFGISHGLFSTSQAYETAPMLHEKFIYLNYVKNKNELSVGLVHEAIWGGSTKEYGKFPNSFKDFFKIFISSDGPFVEGSDHANALGNHLGIWDFSYQKKTIDKVFKLYYQHFFEDTSGLRFANKSDGLWGVELSNYIKNTNILIEYLNTTNQDRDPPYVNDNYYNHYEYIEGWSYKGYSIGNPFIDFNDSNPSKVLHIGISSFKKNKYDYQFLLSRKINTSDSIKYKLSVDKIINHYLVGIVISGNEKGSKNIGIKFSYNL